MNLSEASKNNWYFIEKLSSQDEQFNTRLMSLGLIPGEKILVKRFAPFFKDPILVQVDNIQLAVSKGEAGFIEISNAG